jgi:hypothetical protein
MAKYERSLICDIDELADYIESGIINGSLSASLEAGSYYSNGDTTCIVKVFERYSMIGKNRVALNVTLVSDENDEVFISAITSGGSQAVLFKINTIGEDAFLDKLISLVENYN